MDKFNIKIAETVIGIEARYDYSREYLSDYVVGGEEKQDFCVSVADEDIDMAMDYYPNLSADFAEAVSLYTPIAEKMPEFDAIMFHGAAISYNGRAYLFTAPSGTGKTTHIKLWKKYLDGAVGIINGDKPLIKIKDGIPYVYGTAWAGKEGYQKNTSAPLGAVCIVKRGTECRVSEVGGLAVMSLMRQMYVPKNKAGAGLALDILDKIVTAVPIYEMHCDISESAVKASFEALTGEEYTTKEKSDE